jgi:hypothetical protein
MRNVRYGEVVLVLAKDDTITAEVFGTQMLNDCPAELWDTLDAEEIKADEGALFVKLNGPRHWCLDGLGTKAAVVDPVLKDFNGLTMRRLATIDLSAGMGSVPYEEKFVNRGAVFFFAPENRHVDAFHAGGLPLQLVELEHFSCLGESRCGQQREDGEGFADHGVSL